MNTKQISILIRPLLFWVVLDLPIPASLSTEAWLVWSMAVLMFSWWITDLSMWLNNTVVTVMMMPIAISVAQFIFDDRVKHKTAPNSLPQLW